MANPEDAALHNRLGICYQRMGDAKAARRAYKKAIDLRSDYAEVWNNIGTLDHARSRYKQAISAYSKAIRLDPRSAVFYRNLGGAWLARGEVQKALEAWNEAYRLDPAIFESKGIVAMNGADLARQYYLYASSLRHAGRRGGPSSTCPRRSAWASRTSPGSSTIGISPPSSSTCATRR